VSDIPPKPQLSPEMEELMDRSNMYLVLCGGLCIGTKVQPKTWMIRAKGELAAMKQHTDDLRKLVRANQILADCQDQVDEYLRDRIKRHLSPDKNINASNSQ